MTTAEEYSKKFHELFSAGKYIDAIEYTSKIISDNPNWSMLAGVYQHRSSCYYNLGIDNNNFTYFENALKDCNKVIELMPNDAFGFSMRADCYTQIQQLDKAINDYSKCIELCPNRAYYYECRGFLYIDLNEVEKYIADFSKAIEFGSNNYKIYGIRANYYLQLKQYEKAIDDYSEAIDLCDEKNALYLDAYLDRIKCYNAIRDYENIIKDCKYLLDNEETFEVYAEYDTFDKLRMLYEGLKEYKYNDNNVDKDKLEWFAYMKTAGEAVEKGICDKAIPEYLKAFAIDSQYTVVALKTLIAKPDFSCVHKEIFMLTLNLLTKFQEVMSSMNKDERIEFIEQFLEEENMRKNSNDNIDFSQLHYNPTQGRKLDL